MNLSRGDNGLESTLGETQVRAESWLERAMGFEPTTASLEGWNSTTELRPPSVHCPCTGFLKPINSLVYIRLAHSYARWHERRYQTDLRVLSRRQEPYDRLRVEHAEPKHRRLLSGSLHN